MDYLYLIIVSASQILKLYHFTFIRACRVIIRRKCSFSGQLEDVMLSFAPYHIRLMITVKIPVLVLRYNIADVTFITTLPDVIITYNVLLCYSILDAHPVSR